MCTEVMLAVAWMALKFHGIDLGQVRLTAVLCVLIECISPGPSAGIMPELTRTSYSRYFAWINNKFADLKQEDYDNFKKTAFAGLKDLISSDPKLREEKTLRILEIGAGVGAFACLSFCG